MDNEGVNHLAIIMDGNRRWAKERGLPSVEGHRHGYENLKKVGDLCLERGVKTLTVFGFSTENWKRAATEVDFLMNIMERALDRELDYFIDRQARLRILGRKEGFSPRLQELFARAEEKTAAFDKITFGLCLNYGGRAEIVDAVKRLAAEKIAPEAIDEAALAKRLYWPDMPDPDLVVRTSGEERLSGFLTWQSVYSELYWTKTYWPDFDERELDRALETFASRQRRYGA